MSKKNTYYVSNDTTEILYFPSDEEVQSIHEINIASGLGGYLWNAIKQGISVDEILTALIGEFEMSAEEASHTVKSFLRILMKYGYVRELYI